MDRTGYEVAVASEVPAWLREGDDGWAAAVRYGPHTHLVEAVKSRYDAAPETVARLVEPWEDRPRGVPDYRMLKRPRDFAWDRFHEGLRSHGVMAEFGVLWDDLRATRGRLPLQGVCDAVCAQLLVPFLDEGPFRRSDFDTLMAPWRIALDGCVRSRLFWEVAAHPPFRRDFWPTVDAVLGQGDDGR